jgi:signal transduction histidine kinase
MTQRRLIVSLLLFFVALALPSSILVYQAYGQLKWEAFYQHQRLARELTLRIDAGFRDLIEREENRPISDYEFLNVAGSEDDLFLQRSPLSEYPLQSEVPGLLGYFQVDAEGRLRTPLVPESDAPSYGISALELGQRRQQEALVREILGRNRLVERSDADLAAAIAPMATEEDAQRVERLLAESELHTSLPGRVSREVAAEAPENLGQAAFDELASGSKPEAGAGRVMADQVGDLQLDERYDLAESAPASALAETLPAREEKRSRKEKVNLPYTFYESEPAEERSTFAPEIEQGAVEQLARRRTIRIQTFESEVEAMEFAQLGSGHFVLFRRVFREGERQVQGILIDRGEFVQRMIAPAFRESSLASMSRLIVAYQGDILRRFDPDYSRLYRPGSTQETSELLYQGRLVAPFGDLELIFTLARLPVGAGGQVVIWSALVLALVLVGGCFMLWRLGRRQLALARQQQDFVSAVSHELKTPLTSIRMYGEMLRAGWADESKRKSYYDFIFHEAERLTRLINNVLQLARMSRNEQSASLSPTPVADALRELVPRLESQLEPTGFELEIGGGEDAAETCVYMDVDWFIQIFTNLVDNAVKFSAGADRKRIEIDYRRLRDGRIQFAVRDYGPGIAPDQMKKIFTLFYRSENELTRETVGTGIGLALVRQLAVAMQGEVDVVNKDPGAEFRIRFPAVD